MKKMTAILVTLCMLAALLAGCGGASKSTQAQRPMPASGRMYLVPFSPTQPQLPPPRRRMALTMIWRAPNRKTAD